MLVKDHNNVINQIKKKILNEVENEKLNTGERESVRKILMKYKNQIHIRIGNIA